MKHLFISQYGDRFYASTRKELLAYLCKTKASIMYRDTPNGKVRCGYVIGGLWLTEYAPVERKA
jgi:hypothetical protein